MTELIVLRHGNTFDKGDVVLRVGARTDLDLSVSGRAQAQTVGAHLSETYGAFARIIASPLKRATSTADIVRRATASPVLIDVDARLTEIDYGPDEGAPEADVVARIGQAALDAWEANAEPPPDWRVDLEALTENWRAIFRDLAANATSTTAGPILAVTSNGVARFALAAAIHDSKKSFRQKLRTGAYGRLLIGTDGNARVLEWDIRPPA